MSELEHTFGDWLKVCGPRLLTVPIVPGHVLPGKKSPVSGGQILRDELDVALYSIWLGCCPPKGFVLRPLTQLSAQPPFCENKCLLYY
jgi:hypothetical protein